MTDILAITSIEDDRKSFGLQVILTPTILYLCNALFLFKG